MGNANPHAAPIFFNENIYTYQSRVFCLRLWYNCSVRNKNLNIRGNHDKIKRRYP